MRCFSLQAVYDWSRSLIVPEENRAVQAVGEHIGSGRAVIGGGIPVPADKPSHFGVIVPAGDVVQLRLAVVVVAPVAEGVAGGKIGVVTAGGQDIAPAVIAVGGRFRAGTTLLISVRIAQFLHHSQKGICFSVSIDSARCFNRIP